MSLNQASYYTPLDTSRSDIRILALHQVDSEGRINGSLERVSLLDKPLFVALSYVWGDTASKETIHIDGQAASITTSLAHALRYVKRHWESIYPDRDSDQFRLWADGICINQDDIAERGKQVLLMQSIYAASEATFAWLGPEDVKIPLALDTIEIISQRVQQISPDSDEEVSVDGDEDYDLEWMRDYPLLCEDDNPCGAGSDEYIFEQSSRWSSVEYLFRLPYWSRLWIMQELVLSENLVFLCPSKQLAGQNVFDAAKYMLKVQQAQAHTIKIRPEFLSSTAWHAVSTESILWAAAANIYATRWLHRGRSEETGSTWLSEEGDPTIAYRLAAMSTHLRSSDPRDCVYGLLALTKLDITPDYSPSKTVGDVSADFVRAWLRRYPNQMDEYTSCPPLVFLIDAGLQFPRPPKFPTWAPRFHHTTMSHPFSTGYSEGFRASEGVFGEIFDKPMKLLGFLRVQGVVVQSVTKVLSLPTDKISVTLFHYFVDYTRRASQYPTRLSPVVAFLLVFLRNRGTVSAAVMDSCFTFLLLLARTQAFSGLQSQLSDDEKMRRTIASFPWAIPGQTLAEWFIQEFWDPSAEGSSKQAALTLLTIREQHSIDVSHPCVQQMARTFQHLTYFETEDGYLGLAPKACRPGDFVAVLAGSNIPVILRSYGKYIKNARHGDEEEEVKNEDADADDDVDTDYTDSDNYEGSDDEEDGTEKADSVDIGRKEFAHVGPCFVLGLMDGEAKQFVDDDRAVISPLLLR